MLVKIMLLVPDKDSLFKLREAISKQSNDTFAVITELPNPTSLINKYIDPVFYVRKRITGDDLYVMGENLTLEHAAAYFHVVANFEHLSYGYSINLYKNALGKIGLLTDIVSDDFSDLFAKLYSPKLTPCLIDLEKGD